MLQELKQAGIVTNRKDRYITDKRGLYFVATFNVLERELADDSDIRTVKSLTERLKSIHIDNLTEEETLKKFSSIINQYTILNRKDLANKIQEETELLIEKEADLSDLESY